MIYTWTLVVLIGFPAKWRAMGRNLTQKLRRTLKGNGIEIMNWRSITAKWRRSKQLELSFRLSRGTNPIVFRVFSWSVAISVRLVVGNWPYLISFLRLFTYTTANTKLCQVRYLAMIRDSFSFWLDMRQTVFQFCQIV